MVTNPMDERMVKIKILGQDVVLSGFLEKLLTATVKNLGTMALLFTRWFCRTRR